LLHKVRDSYDLIKNVLSKEYRSLLTFNKNRVIDLNSDTSSDSCDNVSSSVEEEDGTLSKSLRLAVLRGMSLNFQEKEKLKSLVKEK
jgi:hypothetical protein